MTSGVVDTRRFWSWSSMPPGTPLCDDLLYMEVLSYH